MPGRAKEAKYKLKDEVIEELLETLEKTKKIAIELKKDPGNKGMHEKLYDLSQKINFDADILRK
jgi:hypothetical protein